MSEPLTSELVAEVLADLSVAFPRHDGMRTNAGRTCDLYRNGLHGLTGDAVRAAVRRSIEDDKYFPKVSELRTYATEWMKRNQAIASPVEGPVSVRCRVCGEEPEWRKRWRPKVGAQYRPLRTACGTAVLLERYERFLCRCAAPCAFSPDPEYTEPAMRDVPRVTTASAA